MHVQAVADPRQEWDEFARATPGYVLGHAAAWSRVLRDAYGLKPCYLAARDARGMLAGVLPLVQFRTLRGRRELVSLPYLDHAGILAATPEAGRALLDAALALARKGGARALDLRQPTPSAILPGVAGAERIDLILPLEPDEERQWKALRAKVRNQTRKAEREGLEIAGGEAESLLAGFYGPFRENMRDLGSPVHSQRFFAAVAEHFRDDLRLVVTRLGPRPVGGLVALRFGDTVTVPWASTLRSERRRCPNNQIYWEALRWAIRHGAGQFDFGRSPPAAGRTASSWAGEPRNAPSAGRASLPTATHCPSKPRATPAR